MEYRLNEEQFLKEVENHQMTIIIEVGLHRHIRFKQPGTMCQHFDLITWPGYLCYTGDMGTYVFYRQKDMFEFFRTDRSYAHSKGRQLSINPGYWAEKLQSVDSQGRHGGRPIEFSPEKFTQVVKKQLVEWMREGKLDRHSRRQLREAVRDEVLAYADTGEHEAFRAAHDFEHEAFQFIDFWEHDLTEYTHRFMWCCYALAWGISEYDRYPEQNK